MCIIIKFGVCGGQCKGCFGGGVIKGSVGILDSGGSSGIEFLCGFAGVHVNLKVCFFHFSSFLIFYYILQCLWL